jgi:hypothetical protein
MKHHAIEILTLISDHGNAFAAKFINGLGAVSIGSGATLGAVAASSPQIIEQSPLPTIAAIVSIVGGLTFIAKNLFDLYISWRRSKKEDE